MSINDELLQLLRGIAADSIQYAEIFRFDKSHPQKRTVILLYCRILELMQSELTLFGAGQATAAPIVFRSIFEAYADLLALLSDPQYHKKMRAQFLHEKRRLLRTNAKTPSNPILNGVFKNRDTKSDLSNLETELAQLKSEGHDPLNNVERFARAGLVCEYGSIYWQLCLEGHNNMAVLEARHIEMEGNDYRVTLFNPASSADLLRLLDGLINIVIDSSAKVHSHFGTTATSTYKSHLRAFKAIRARYRPVPA